MAKAASGQSKEGNFGEAGMGIEAGMPELRRPFLRLVARSDRMPALRGQTAGDDAGAAQPAACRRDASGDGRARRRREHRKRRSPCRGHRRRGGSGRRIRGDHRRRQRRQRRVGRDLRRPAGSENPVSSVCGRKASDNPEIGPRFGRRRAVRFSRAAGNPSGGSKPPDPLGSAGAPPIAAGSFSESCLVGASSEQARTSGRRIRAPVAGDAGYRAAVRGGAHSAADLPGSRCVLLRTRCLATAHRREPETPPAVFPCLHSRLGLPYRPSAQHRSAGEPVAGSRVARSLHDPERRAPETARRGSFLNRRGRGRLALRNPPASERRRPPGSRCALGAADLPHAPEAPRNALRRPDRRRRRGAVLRVGAAGPAAAILVATGRRLAHRPAGAAHA